MQGIRDTARGAVKLSTRRPPATSASPASPAAATCCPVSPETPRPRPAPRPTSTSRLRRRVRRRSGPADPPDVGLDGYGGWTATYTQSYKGVPVFGALLRAHVDAPAALTAVNGFAAPGIDMSTDASRTQAQAADRAIAFVKSAPAPRRRRRGRAHGADDVGAKIYVYREGAIRGVAGRQPAGLRGRGTNGGTVREKVFVDASSGKVLNRYSMIDNALDRELYETSLSARPTWSGRRATRSRAASTRTSRTW